MLTHMFRYFVRHQNLEHHNVVRVFLEVEGDCPHLILNPSKLHQVNDGVLEREGVWNGNGRKGEYMVWNGGGRSMEGGSK